MSTSELFRTLPIPATWPCGPLGVAVPLQSRSRQSKERCPPPAGRQCFLASPPCPEPGCTPAAHQRRHWRKPFLFNKGHVPMFPRCCCCVLWEKPRRRLAHCGPFDYRKAVFSSTLVLASGPLSEPVTHSSQSS